MTIDLNEESGGFEASLSSTAIIAVLEDELYLQEQRQTALVPVDPPVIKIPSGQRRKNRIVLILVGLVFIIGMMSGGSVATLFFVQPMPIPMVPEAAETDRLASTPTVVTNVLTITTGAASIPITHCGESKPKEYIVNPEFIYQQGVSLFKQENSSGAILNNLVRSVEINQKGLWAGYLSAPSNKSSGITLYSKPQWFDCTIIPALQDQTINDIKTDHQGRIWIATEKAGVSTYDGQNWKTYTINDGLPSNEIFGITIDNMGNIWAATWEGAAVFSHERWDEAYSVYKGMLQNNHLHAIAFDQAGNIWLGHINTGVSRYDNSQGIWVYYTQETGEIAGNEVKNILVRPAQNNTDESIWIATNGGISRYEAGEWVTYTESDGLPSNHTMGLAVDRYNRVWAATEGGVAYFDDHWTIYHTLPALDVALGYSCSTCPIDDDHVWTATRGYGLTHSRLPLPFQVIDIINVKYPKTLAPGEKFRPEITVSPRYPYTLDENRGDFLANIDQDPKNRFGAYTHVKVRGLISSGEPFTFTDYDSLFVAPNLSPNETERTFTSSWRVWMHTRYVGPPIIITFTVRR